MEIGKLLLGGAIVGGGLWVWSNSAKAGTLAPAAKAPQPTLKYRDGEPLTEAGEPFLIKLPDGRVLGDATKWPAPGVYDAAAKIPAHMSFDVKILPSEVQALASVYGKSAAQQVENVSASASVIGSRGNRYLLRCVYDINGEQFTSDSGATYATVQTAIAAGKYIMTGLARESRRVL